MNARLLLLLLLSLPWAVAAQEERAASRPLVLTSLAPVHQLALALTRDAAIRVENMPVRPRPMAALPAFFARQAERFSPQFEGAEAVISIARIWPADPLYASARQFNIRVVPIDASQPWSQELSGVAVARSPVSGEVSPYFWTSPSNVIRALEIMAQDLQALFPDQAASIAANLGEERSYFMKLKADMENRLLAAPDPAIYALTDNFVYLTRDLGIFVADYFVKQDIDWTEEDLAMLAARLRAAGIKTVVHKWEPAPPIMASIEAAGARLAVLDAMETTEQSLRIAMRSNLEALLEALGGSE